MAFEDALRRATDSSREQERLRLIAADADSRRVERVREVLKSTAQGALRYLADKRIPPRVVFASQEYVPHSSDVSNRGQYNGHWELTVWKRLWNIGVLMDEDGGFFTQATQEYAVKRTPWLGVSASERRLEDLLTQAKLKMMTELGLTGIYSGASRLGATGSVLSLGSDWPSPTLVGIDATRDFVRRDSSNEPFEDEVARGVLLAA